MPTPKNTSRSPSLAEVQAELADVKRHLAQQEEARRNDLRIAERVHRSMLPKPVRHDRIHVDTRYVPVEEVGGDYCQVLFPDDAICYISICDVTGHGLGPAMLATRFSSEVRRLVSLLLPPDEIVQKLNHFVFHNFMETRLQVTSFLTRFDFEKMSITFSGAGHPSALLIPHGSQSARSLDSQNMLIGVSEHCLSDRPSGTHRVSPGDRLIFFTDGVTETKGAEGKLLGTQELIHMATVTCAGDFASQADCLLEQINAFRVGPPLDDLTLILAQLQ